MKQRLIALMLAAGCIVLGVIAFLLYAGQDRKAPKIKVKEASITYTEGDNYDSLMEGISAKDNVDGDLSDEVFVDKIVPTENGQAIVYYGVMDSSRNVGTAKRKITYIMKDNEEEPVSADAAEAEEDASKEEEADQETEAKEEDTKNSAEKESEEELKPDGERPAMALTETKMTIKKGETFDPLSVVKNAVDDKDDRTTLYQHIHADGTYDTKKKGTYEIRYYVSDSDGNTSEPQIFTLKVE